VSGALPAEVAALADAPPAVREPAVFKVEEGGADVVVAREAAPVPDAYLPRSCHAHAAYKWWRQDGAGKDTSNGKATQVARPLLNKHS